MLCIVFKDMGHSSSVLGQDQWKCISHAEGVYTYGDPMACTAILNKTCFVKKNRVILILLLTICTLNVEAPFELAMTIWNQVAAHPQPKADAIAPILHVVVQPLT